MRIESINKGAYNSPIENIAIVNDDAQSKANQGQQTHVIKALFALQDIRDEAWQKAIKYRFDPVIGKMHQEYLDALNDILRECVA